MSNFDVAELDRVIAIAKARLVVDQVQFSPFQYRRRLLEAAERKHVVLEAYSPLGTGRHLSNPAVTRIAEDARRFTVHEGAAA